MPAPSPAKLGLALYPDQVVLVQVGPNGASGEGTIWGAAPTPSGVMEGAQIQDPARLAGTLRHLVRALGVRGHSVTVVLEPTAYSLRSFRLPDVPPGERRALLRNELELARALPAGLGAFDSLWLRRDLGTHQESDVYAWFTTDAIVGVLRATLRSAGLQLAALEPPSLATLRAYLHQTSVTEPTAFLQPFEGHSDLYIYNGRQIRHLRRIPAGLEDLGKVMAPPAAPAVPASNPEAGNPGRAYLGEDPTAAGPGSSAASPPDDPRGEAGSFLASELVRSLAYYQREFPTDPRPAVLVILGGTEATGWCVEALRGKLPLGVSPSAPNLDSPATGTPDVPLRDEALYTMAIGAAISGSDGLVPQMDVAQQDATAARRDGGESWKRALLTSTGAVAALGVIGGLLLINTLQGLRSENKRLAGEIVREQQDRGPEAQQQALERAIAEARQRSAIPAGEALRSVAQSGRRGISLSTLQIGSDGGVRMEGVGLTSDDVERCLSGLERGGVVLTPVIEQLGETPDERISFRITGRVRSAEGGELRPAGDATNGGGQ